MANATAHSVTDDYAARGYGAYGVGFGDRPGVLVVDFQRANTDPSFPLEGRRWLSAPLRIRFDFWQLPGGIESLSPSATRPITVQRTRLTGRSQPCARIFGTAIPARRSTGAFTIPEYDVLVCKTGPSMMFQTPVVPFFIRQRVDTVIVTGCNTSGCIRATAVDSFQHGFRTIVPEDCVGDIEQEPHENNLRDIGRRYVDVVDADSVIAYFETLPRRNDAGFPA